MFTWLTTTTTFRALFQQHEHVGDSVEFTCQREKVGKLHHRKNQETDLQSGKNLKKTILLAIDCMINYYLYIECYEE